MLHGLALLGLLAYPLLIYFSLDHLGPLILGFILVALLALRLLASGLLQRRGLSLLFLLVCGLFLAGLSLTDDARLIKFYPVAINLVLLVMFASSLVFPPTLIERGLRMAGREVPAHAPPYLWWVTLAWSLFFIANAVVSCWTALFGSLATWTFYNGFLSYLLIGLGFGVERLARALYQRRMEARSD